MGIRADIDGFALVFLALLCLTVPLNWLLAALLAALFHELCHILTLWALGGRIYDIRLDSGGAVLDAADLTPGRELAAILAGPMGSLSLLLLVPVLPRTALCGAVQGLFNLLPVYPLDGGRALDHLSEMLFPPELAEKVCSWVKWTVCFLIFAVGLWGTFAAKLGILPFLGTLFLLSRATGGKIPCKPGHLGVQ